VRLGYLGNTFVMIGRVSIFIDVLCQAMPNAMLALSVDMVENDLDSSFRVIPNVDFSRDVLALQPERLLVIRDSTSVWTEQGNPDRIFDTLKHQKSNVTLARVDQPA